MDDAPDTDLPDQSDVIDEPSEGGDVSDSGGDSDPGATTADDD
ncbi:MAG TPA: hypothetical protein VHK88_15815 [Aquihabitans sp.]|jgi:hypothetical protein|nr:hypothetical protein [Aquihabitans sp.]